MPENNSPQKKQVETERAVLSALCGSACPDATILQVLDRYAWESPEHQVVFETIRRFHEHGHEPILKFLPAEATRRGFPDVDWSLYPPKKVSRKEIADMIQELKAAREQR